MFRRHDEPERAREHRPRRRPAGAAGEEARALVAHGLQAEHERDERGRERERDEERRQVVLDVGAGELPVPDGRQPARPRRRHVQQVVRRRSRGVADAAQQVRGEDEGDRDPVRAARRAEQLGREQAEREERDAGDRDRRPPDERAGRVEAVRDQRERDEQAERDVGEHAVDDGRGRRQDPTRRGRGDRLGATLLLLLAGVAHGEERAHQAAHERQPGEEQEERERAVVDAVRRAAEDEDGPGRDRDAEDLAPVLLLAVGVVHRGDGGVRQQRGADDPQRELQPVAADALPEQHEEPGHARASASTGASSSP